MKRGQNRNEVESTWQAERVRGGARWEKRAEETTKGGVWEMISAGFVRQLSCGIVRQPLEER